MVIHSELSGCNQTDSPASTAENVIHCAIRGPLPRTAISESAAPSNIDKVPNGRCTPSSRPSAPEGVAQGRATILPGQSRGRSWRSSFPSQRATGVRVPVSSEPYLRRHRDMMVSRRNVAIKCRASCTHGGSRAGPSVDDAGCAAGSRYGSRLLRIP